MTRLKKKIKLKRALKTWELVVIILGFPLWFPLLLSLGAILLSLVVLVACGVVALIATDIALALGGVVGFFGGILMATNGFGLGGFIAGCSLVALGLFIFLTFGCRAAVRSIGWSCKKLWHGFKAILPKRKESAE